ncbi:FadR/GntR family transcriptional regulator [Tistrella bauzanensis]|uniref:FadR/GntR family transcriptional regulator n=1 Tax=Tistrella arctica TaxID=3133430 RepID=A0ABU9YPX2_9PROT
MSMPAAINRRSLVDAAIEGLRAQITEGTWAVGGRIPPEPELAQALGVGRGTVREAVRALAYLGMLEVRQGDGTYVRAMAEPGQTLRRVAHAGHRDHLELRAALEIEAARLAALRCTPAALARIDAALALRGSIEPAPSDPVAFDIYIDHDIAFHVAVAEAGGNAALAELYCWFTEQLRRYLRLSLADRSLPEPSLAAHVAVRDAIAARDPDAAAQAARDLLAPVVTTVEQRLAATMPPAHTSSPPSRTRSVEEPQP